MGKENIKQGILKNSFWNFTSKIIGKFGALIFTIIIARLLQPENYGIYTLAMSVALFFMEFSNLGVNKTLVRYISSSLGKKNNTNAYFRYITKIKITLAIIISLALLILAYPLSIFLFDKPSLFLPIIFASFYIFVFSFEDYFSFLFYSAKNTKYISIKETLSKTGRILILFFVFYAVSKAFHIEGIIIGLSII